MKILENDKNPILKAIGDMDRGECFRDEDGDVIMVTDAPISSNNDDCLCVLLRTGRALELDCNDEYPVVEVTATVEPIYHDD